MIKMRSGVEEGGRDFRDGLRRMKRKERKGRLEL